MSIEVDWSEARVPNARSLVRAEHTLPINSSGSRQELDSSSGSVESGWIGAKGLTVISSIFVVDLDMLKV